MKQWINNFFKSKKLTLFLFCLVVIVFLWQIRIFLVFVDQNQGERWRAVIPLKHYAELQKKEFLNFFKKTLYPNPKKSKLPQFHISIEPKNLKKLNKSLPASGKKYIPVKINFQGKSFNGKLKYKGDNSYHWYYSKKSFQLKLKQEKTIWNHDTLIFRNIKSGSMMSEYIGNFIASKFNLLSIDEKYVDIYINGKYKGLYLYTESFKDKAFFETKEYTENTLYRGEHHSKDLITGSPWNLFQNPYGWEILGSNETKEPLKSMINSLRKINYENKAVYDELFKIINRNYFENFMAWAALVETYHYDHYHNLVFYNNPSSGKLIQLPVDSVAFMLWHNPQKNLDIASNDLYKAFLRNPDFIYNKNKILWTKLIAGIENKILKEIKTTHKKIEASIYADFSKAHIVPIRIPMSYQEHLDYLKKLKIKIKQMSSEYKTLLEEVNVKYKINEAKNQIDFLVNGWSSVRVEEINTSCQTNQVFRSTNIPLQKNELLHPGRITNITEDWPYSLALSPAPLTYSFFIKNNCKIDSLKLKNAITENEVIPKKVDSFDEIPLSNFSYHPWKIEQEKAETLSLKLKKIKEQYPQSIIKNNRLIIPAPQHTTSENIIIPQEIFTKIFPGTTLLLDEGVSIISYGKVFAEGTKEHPITVKAKNSEKPFGVFALANEEASGSQFKYFQIEHGSETIINGIYFSGMFSAYHNDNVLVENSKFSYAHADDALNFKYSNSKVLSSEFYKNSADAIDFDFMSGEIRGNKFIENGNDSIDTSGATTLIRDNYISKSGDKCMSFGEKSNTVVINNILDGCFIGVECKDSTTSVLINNAIINNKTAVNAYQKKDFFGPAHCEFHNSIFAGNKRGIVAKNNFNEKGKKISDTSETSIKNSILPYPEYDKNENIIEKILPSVLSDERIGNIEKLKEVFPEYINPTVNIGIFNKEAIPFITP